jgi:ribosomal protein S12 methylthiotransferase
MLERMRRETSPEYIEDLIGQLRVGIPDITLRTTFIVGFPGETEAYFQTLLQFLRKARFERVGIFTYSKEEGTRAGSMAAQIPDKVKRQRRDQAMAEQLKIAREISSSFVGRTLRVLTEKQASAQELQNASLSSWEHGLIRSQSDREPKLTGKWVVARGKGTHRTSTGVCLFAGTFRSGILPTRGSLGTPITI